MKELTKLEHLEIVNNSIRQIPYGSVVYGTYTPNTSDKDCICIVYNSFADKIKEDNQAQYTFEDGTVHQMTFYTEDEFFERLENNEIDVLECVFSNYSAVRKILPDTYTLNFSIYADDYSPLAYSIYPEKIRDNFSKTASNSWVKCKKKLTVDKDFAPRVGKKSLWHALRLIDFGTQILCFGWIENFSSMNFLYDEIVNNECNDWEFYKNKYQPFYNALKSNFRISETDRTQYKNPEEVYKQVKGN